MVLLTVCALVFSLTYRRYRGVVINDYSPNPTARLLFSQDARCDRFRKRRAVVIQQFAGEPLEGGELIVPDVVAITFCEAVE